MARDWIQEKNPHWDDAKAAIVGGAPEGIFDFGNPKPGDSVPGEWWRVDDDGRTVGFGWLDTTWNGAEVLLAVAPDQQGKGVGTFIVDHLEKEAASREQNYIFNEVAATHPDREGVTKWLEAHGFEGTEDGQLRRRVKAG